MPPTPAYLPFVCWQGTRRDRVPCESHCSPPSLPPYSPAYMVRLPHPPSALVCTLSQSSAKTILVAFFSSIPSLGPKAPYSLCSFFFTAVPNFKRAGGTSCPACRKVLTRAPALPLSPWWKKVWAMPFFPARPVRPILAQKTGKGT